MKCSDATVKRKLEEAVERKWLAVEQAGRALLYSVTVEGRNAIRNVGF